MFNHALVFLVIALLAGAFGFGVLAGDAAIAKVFCVILLAGLLAAVRAARPPADPADPLSFPFFPSLP